MLLTTENNNNNNAHRKTREKRMNRVIEVKSMHRERKRKRKKRRQKMRKTIHQVTASTVTGGLLCIVSGDMKTLQH
jgi:hypothetical protein